MQKNSFERFINRWMKSVINDIDKLIKREMVNQNCSAALVKTGLATITIQEQPGKSERNFSATWIYNYKDKMTTLLRIEWHGHGFKVFTNPPVTRKQRREKERKEFKVIQMPEDKTLITDAKIGDIETEARAQEYLEAEKKKPSTITDKLK